MTGQADPTPFRNYTFDRLIKMAAYYERAGKNYTKMVKAIRAEIERRTK